MAEEEEIFGTETLWRGMANFISRYEQYEKSLKYYDLAVATTPTEKKTLIDRARARARCNNYEGALQDIKKALTIDEADLIALAEKAHTTFLNTDFEEALIQNHRLLPLRRKPDHFFLGILKCISTIEQCLGDIAGKPLRDHFLIIRKLAWKWNMESIKERGYYPRGKESKKKKKIRKERRRQSLFPEDEAMRIRDRLHSHKEDTFTIPPFITEVNFAPLQRFTKNIENYMAERYLDRMYREKEFLKTMAKHPGISTPNPVGTKHLKDLARDSYIAVSQKQEVLRTARPFYFLKYQEAKITGNLKSRQEADLLLHQQNYRKEAEKILQKLDKASKEKKLPDILDFSEKLITFCKPKPKRLLPEKDEYIHKMHDYLRKGYYELYRLNPEQVKWDQDKRIMVCLDQPISREPSTDSVIKQFHISFVDLKQQIDLFHNRLEKAETMDEICWCYHELARGFSLHEALAMIEEDEFSHPAVDIVMLPPNDGAETDEDSGDENIMSPDNLPSSQLRTLAEIQVPSQLDDSDPDDSNIPLSRYSMLGNNFDAARIYAKKCLIDIADKENLEEWYLSITMILLRTNMKEKNKIDALSEARTAMQIAEKRKDRILKEYLRRAISLINDIEFDDITGAKLTEKRQKKILALMGNDKLKEEFASLFRAMAAMPSARRFTILPDAYKPKSEGTASQLKLSKGKSRSKVLIEDTTASAPEGAGFMQLIQFQL